MTDHLTRERLAEIKARAEAATPGPWRATHRAFDLTENDDESSGLGLEIAGPPGAWNRGQFEKGADAVFIAHARSDVPALLAHIEAVERTNAGLRKQCGQAAIALQEVVGIAAIALQVESQKRQLDLLHGALEKVKGGKL